MNKKIFLLVLLTALLFDNISAQKNCNVDMLDMEKKRSEIVCFKRDTFPNDNFKTKYIFLLDGSEVYEVNFSFYEEKDSSFFKIFYIDRRTNVSGTKYVKFKAGSSYYIIKNFKPNDLVIEYEDYSYSILFSVPNEDVPYVILNKFLSLKDEKIRFKLTHIDPKVLADHIAKTKNFIEMEYRDSVGRANYSHAAESLKNKMAKYKDSIITKIKSEEELNKIKGSPQRANNLLQAEFIPKLDSIFIDYFKRVNTFRNDEFKVNFTFTCNGDGKIKIDTIKSIRFIAGSQNNWLRDSFTLKLNPRIEAGVYKLMTVTYANENVKSDFLSWFEESFNSNATPNLNKPDFTEMRNQISDTLEQYETRQKSFPTVYSYSFEYKSTVNNVVWRYERNNDGTDNITDKTSDKVIKEEMTEELKTIFRNKIAGGKKGKYHIKIFSVYLKGALKPSGQDIQLIEK